MPSPLEALYVGPMAALEPPGVGESPPSALAARELLEPGRLAARLDHFALQYDRGDRRAVASLWSKWHFSAVISAGLAANLLLERDLPLGLEALHLEPAPEGQTHRLWLAHAGTPLASQAPFVRFATLIDDHLAPLIAALAAHSGASPKVFWSNAGNYFEYFAEALEAHPMASPGAAEPARELLAARQLPDGRRNPLYQPVRYLADAAEGEPERRRRLCCIRYLIPELGYCGNCPLSHRDTRR